MNNKVIGFVTAGASYAIKYIVHTPCVRVYCSGPATQQCSIKSSNYIVNKYAKLRRYRNPPIVIYADILISCSLAAVLEIYTQHFTRRLHFAQQYEYLCKLNAHSSRFDTIQFEFHDIFHLIFYINGKQCIVLYSTVNNFFNLQVQSQQ